MSAILLRRARGWWLAIPPAIAALTLSLAPAVPVAEDARALAPGDVQGPGPVARVSPLALHRTSASRSPEAASRRRLTPPRRRPSPIALVEARSGRALGGALLFYRDTSCIPHFEVRREAHRLGGYESWLRKTGTRLVADAHGVVQLPSIARRVSLLAEAEGRLTSEHECFDVRELLEAECPRLELQVISGPDDAVVARDLSPVPHVLLVLNGKLKDAPDEPVWFLAQGISLDSGRVRWRFERETPPIEEFARLWIRHAGADASTSLEEVVPGPEVISSPSIFLDGETTLVAQLVDRAWNRLSIPCAVQLRCGPILMRALTCDGWVEFRGLPQNRSYSIEVYFEGHAPRSKILLWYGDVHSRECGEVRYLVLDDPSEGPLLSGRCVGPRGQPIAHRRFRVENRRWAEGRACAFLTDSEGRFYAIAPHGASRRIVFSLRPEDGTRDPGQEILSEARLPHLQGGVIELGDLRFTRDQVEGEAGESVSCDLRAR